MSHLQLRAADGHTFSPTSPGPQAAPRGAVVVVQEIFGVTGHIERVAEQYAAEGYLAIAPALFDRQQRGVNLPYDDAGIAQGVGFMQRADFGQAMADLNAAIDAVAHAGAVGMVGYCWGGLVDLPGRQPHEHRGGRRLLRRRHHPVARAGAALPDAVPLRRAGHAHPAERRGDDPGGVPAGRVPHLRRGPRLQLHRPRELRRGGRAPGVRARHRILPQHLG